MDRTRAGKLPRENIANKTFCRKVFAGKAKKGEEETKNGGVQARKD
jgi:hypothetical protein